ncbi:phosphotransferase [Falsibacillus albus]|nr:phosphotransferase [Falsibacillus albus]
MTSRYFDEGDGFNTRLLQFLNQVFNQSQAYIKQLRIGLWKYKIGGKTWLVKQFSSRQKLQNQIALTNRLRQSGFHQSYRFHDIHYNQNILVFEQKIFGIIEFIKTSKEVFSFQEKSKRDEALEVINRFHMTTSTFVQHYFYSIPFFNQIEKWKQRLFEFKSNRFTLENHLPPYILSAYIEWGEWALDRMEKNQAYFLRKPYCIIHGDVAFHNFLLNRQKTLCLIDFDLISVAPPLVDYLQIANRFLPSIHWSVKDLFEHKLMEKFSRDPLFLIALIYPTDVFREWNRFVKSDEVMKNTMWPFLYDLSIHQFPLRMAMVNNILQTLEVNKGNLT